jgi:AsmA family protein
MKGLPRVGKWGVAAAAVVLGLAGIGTALILALDAGYFRAPFVAYLRAHFNRAISIDGPMQLRLWSGHPRIVAQQVTIGNPSWVAAGDMARIERLTVVFDGPRPGHAAVLQSISMDGATLHLLRDAAGHANWQRFNPDSGAVGKGLPLIRELSATDAHLLLDDQLRHLQFDGTVSAQGSGQTGGPARLHMEGKGQLNGKTTNLELSGDPLGSVRRDVPYAFEFMEQSGGSRVDLHGSLPQPFDFNLMDGTFEASGANLKDLYFLTGVTLVNTGAYRLSGSIARRGTSTSFDQLKLTTGQSDVAGTLSSHPQDRAANRGAANRGAANRGTAERGEPVTGRSLLEGTLTAGVLHLADFGARAATRGIQPASVQAPPLLFSDAALNPEGLRRSDAQVRFEARRVDVGSTPVQSLSGQMKIDRGVVSITAVRGEVMQGKFEARLKLDANKNVPIADISMRFNDLQLATLEHKQQEPPLDGLMQVRIDITGQGVSLHQIAASANGSVSATVPHGTIRASLAELTGVDLRGLGLTLTRSKRETAVRCAAATFEAHDGTLSARSIVIDTEPVLIRGEGSVRLDTESLDIVLRGEPKEVRLMRMDAPILIRGTLRQPALAIQTHDSSVKLIDPGNGKSVDCASLLAPPRQQPVGESAQRL